MYNESNRFSIFQIQSMIYILVKVSILRNIIQYNFKKEMQKDEMNKLRSQVFQIFSYIIKSRNEINLVKVQLTSNPNFNLKNVFISLDKNENDSIKFTDIMSFFNKNQLKINQNQAKRIVEYFTTKNQIQKSEFFVGIIPFPQKYIKKVNQSISEIIIKLFIKILDTQEELIIIKNTLKQEMYQKAFESISSDANSFKIEDLINLFKTHKKNINLIEAVAIFGDKIELSYQNFKNIVNQSKAKESFISQKFLEQKKKLISTSQLAYKNKSVMDFDGIPISFTDVSYNNLIMDKSKLDMQYTEQKKARKIDATRVNQFEFDIN